MKRKTIASGLKGGYIICASTRKIKASKSELSALRANKIGSFGSIVQAVSNFLNQERRSTEAEADANLSWRLFQGELAKAGGTPALPGESSSNADRFLASEPISHFHFLAEDS